MSEAKPPPDFATVRAVEILASIALGARKNAIVPPPPIDRPVILFNETQSFQIGKTTRVEAERALGTGYPFPGKGWHTYAVRTGSGRRLLSVVYSKDVLSGAEFYIPKTDKVPALAPRNFGDFRRTGQSDVRARLRNPVPGRPRLRDGQRRAGRTIGNLYCACVTSRRSPRSSSSRSRSSSIRRRHPVRTNAISKPTTPPGAPGTTATIPIRGSSGARNA
jgi:hypothetical protein